MKIDKLKELLDDHQTGMSEFQDDYFVTGKAGTTPYAQYQQALREVYKRFRGLRELIYGEGGQKLLDLEIRRLQKQLEETEDDLDREELEIKLQHKIILQEECERVIEDTYREFTRFYQQAEQLKKQVGELTPERRRELETEMWEEKARELLALDYLQFGQPSRKSFEFIRSLPSTSKMNLLDEARNNKEKLVENYLNTPNSITIDYKNLNFPEIDYERITKLINS